jgi:hypothetical protein
VQLQQSDFDGVQQLAQLWSVLFAALIVTAQTLFRDTRMCMPAYAELL